MLDWLAASFDPSRTHDLSSAVAWHGRLMVLTWSGLFPIGIIAARFYKVTSRQKWPEQLDNKFWWYTHNTLQYCGLLAMLIALGLVLASAGLSLHGHALLGWAVVLLTVSQVFSGWLRGTKGGPTEPSPDGSLHGDHYAMTRRRRIFERVHKSMGYLALFSALGAVPTGLWMVNAPRWMWLLIFMWWIALLAFAIVLQRRGSAIDTYQAIWGPDIKHPGNRRQPSAWGMRRHPGDPM